MFHSRGEEVKELKHNVLEKIKTPRVRALTSTLDNIPTALPINNHSYKLVLANEMNVAEDNKIIVNKIPNNSICNSYRFVVNYGYFEPYFEWIPNELLTRIFSFLNARDLLTVALVCKNWLEATKYFRIARKNLLHLQVFKYSDTAHPMNKFLLTTRFFPNVKFSIVKFTPHNDQYWMNFGDVVENLTFNSCLLSKSEFLRIIRMCPHLQSLEIVRCDDIYKTWTVVKKLKSIKMKHEFLNTLVIQETSSISREIFDFMVTSFPNITSLTLSNCLGNMKSTARTAILESIIIFLQKRARHIKILNLVNTPTDDFFLEQLSGINDLKLNEFHLTFNGIVSSSLKSGLIMVIRKQKQLEILDLTESKGLTNYCLVEICLNITKLKKLVLSKCWMINDVGLREVNRLTELEQLDITSCDRVTDLGLLEGLIPNGRKFNKLKHLHLGLLPYMSILAIYRLSQQYDELQLLDLSGSSNSITDEAIQMIFRYQEKLTYLNLDCCAKITDFGITGLSESEDDDFKNYIPYNIDSLKALRFINLSGCYHITDKSLVKTFNLPELREINLARCFNITEIGLKEICQKCPYLEIVDFSEVFHIVDSTIDMISLKSSKMETLKLNGCNQITALALEYLKNCKYLKNLYIRRCNKIEINPYEILKTVRYIYDQ